MCSAFTLPIVVKAGQFDESKHRRVASGEHGGEFTGGGHAEQPSPERLSQALQAVGPKLMGQDSAWRHIHNFKSPGWSKPQMGSIGGAYSPTIKLMADLKGGDHRIFAVVALVKGKYSTDNPSQLYEGRAALFASDGFKLHQIHNPKDKQETFDSPTEAMHHAEIMLAHHIKKGDYQEVPPDSPLHAVIEQRKGEHLAQAVAAKRAGQTMCDRCGGVGTIDKYRHVEGGVCFKCTGAGYLAIGKKSISAFHLPLLVTKAGFGGPWDESKHRRGQPENRGEFASGGGGGGGRSTTPRMGRLVPSATRRPAGGRATPPPLPQRGGSKRPSTPGTGKPAGKLGEPKSQSEVTDQMIWLLGRASILREHGRNNAHRMTDEQRQDVAKKVTLAVHLANRLRSGQFTLPEVPKKADPKAAAKPAAPVAEPAAKKEPSPVESAAAISPPVTAPVAASPATPAMSASDLHEQIAKHPGARKFGLTKETLAKMHPDAVQNIAEGLGIGGGSKPAASQPAEVTPAPAAKPAPAKRSRTTSPKHSIKLPKDRKKLTISHAAHALDEMGHTLGSPKHDLSTHTTTYEVTSHSDGTKTRMSAEQVREMVYRGKGRKKPAAKSFVLPLVY